MGKHLVGCIDHLSNQGKIVERQQFTDYKEFQARVKECLYYGIPIAISVDRDPDTGLHLPIGWLANLDASPVSFRFESLNTPQKPIRFVDADYNKLFELPDGGNLILTYLDGTEHARQCRRIDDYHVKVGRNVYRISEFAQLCRMNGTTIRPEVPYSGDCIDTYEIYQIPLGESVSYEFSDFSEEFSISDYTRVYAGMLAKETTPEDIFALHNRDNRPLRQHGRSLSVSDVIILHRDGKVQALYVEQIGFRDITERMQTIHNEPDKTDLLLEQLTTEQEQFRSWLLRQSPEEILNHTHQYWAQEDIILAIQEQDVLSERQAGALLKAKSPLTELYREFNKQESSHMDEIRMSIECRANALLEKQKKLPEREER